jgi:hypothetical protein
VLYQQQQATNGACHDFTVGAQEPFISATGANRVPGNLILKTYAATNGGTTHASVKIQAKATDVLVVSHNNTNGTISLPTMETTTSDPGGTVTYMKFTVNGATFWVQGKV